MKIVVISDSHRNFEGIYRVFSENQNADLFIFLGDGVEELEDMMSVFPQKEIWYVAGNGDYFSSTKTTDIGDVQGKRILYTHGHTLNVKSGLTVIAQKAMQYNADLVLFGHTHVPTHIVQEGVHYFNPGSITAARDGKNQTYGIVTINDGEIECRHVVV